MNTPKTDNQLPAVGSIIECQAEEAIVYANEHKGERHFSVCAYKATDGRWALSHRKAGGLRIHLGNVEPKGYVRRVEITKHCRQLTCCFGIIV